MSESMPKYAVRGKVDANTDGETMVRYMAQVIAGILGIAIEAGTPVISGRPRDTWRVDWQRLCEDGTAEEKIYGLLLQEEPEELRRTFNLALTIAANGLIATHQLDFLTAFGSVMANVLATEGGAREYLHPEQS